MRVEVRQTEVVLSVETGDSATITVRDERVHVAAGSPVRVPLSHQGRRLHGALTTSDIEGTRRSDGTVITASIPTISMTPEPEVLTGP